MNNLSESLLYEIIKLWRKYGKSAFTDLSEMLSQDNFSEEVAHLLENYMNTVSKEKKSKRKRSQRGNLNTKILNDIEKMRNEQPEKATLLLDLSEQLMNKEILPKMKDIRMFLEYEQLPMTMSSNRNNTIRLLIKLFMNMTINELRRHMSNLPKTSDTYQRSLSRWSDIISRKNINESEQNKIEY